MKTIYIPCDSQEYEVLGKGFAYDAREQAQSIVDNECRGKPESDCARYEVIEIDVDDKGVMLVDETDLDSILDALDYGREVGYEMPPPSATMLETLTDNGLSTCFYVEWM
ncbi:MAG: hypothetical protein FWG81_04755 [Betaproteobacteria bacterium]|nr:hypothetical protein [Betaproteobacteria bacterium]